MFRRGNNAPALMRSLVAVPNDGTNVIAGQTYTAQNAANYSMRSKPAPGGASIDRFELRNGDYLSFDGPIKERCEYAALANQYVNGTTVWVSYAMFIPLSTVFNQYTIIGQLHATEGPGDTTDFPPLSVEVRIDGRTRYTASASTQVPLTAQPPGTTVYDDMNLIRGAWVNFVHQFRCDATGASSLWKVWKNGVLLFNYTGPMGQLSSPGDYWKYGLYRASNPANKDAVVYYANMEAGTADLSARVTSPLAPPSGIMW